jgi:cytochrome c oxidase assembly protein subunit 11
MAKGYANSRHMGLVTRLALTSCAMFVFGFALVPLYDIFCEITGIRIPIEASAAETITESTDSAVSRDIKLLLLASTQAGTPLEFQPLNDIIDVSTGRIQETQFIARNLSKSAVTGIATPDIRPAEAGRYIRKIECFCFNDQLFAPGEERKLNVRFYVDPELPAHIDSITLAYTLFEKQQVASNQ